MFSRFQLLTKYLHYYRKAANAKGHGMHSPFVFQLITAVLNDKAEYPAYRQVEVLRRELKANPAILQVEDFGAGSVLSKSKERSIASIATNAAKPKKFGQLLYRLVQQYQPQVIVELGTSLGISSCYLAMGNKAATLYTMEGAAAIATVAQQNFIQLQLKNIQLIQGNFDDTLPELIKQLQKVDFVFIDGNHRKEPTLSYFEQLLPLTHNDTIIVFDDIHWSRGMEDAWSVIQQHPSVRCSIDLFFIGIILFRKEFKEKQHFAIRF
jgi:predicted O-methyltransferase YrrM